MIAWSENVRCVFCGSFKFLSVSFEAQNYEYVDILKNHVFYNVVMPLLFYCVSYLN